MPNPKLDLGHAGRVREAEAMVEKLRKHFNEYAYGDAIEQMVHAAELMDDWLWNPTVLEPRFLGFEELYVASPGLGGAVCSESWAWRSCM